MAGGYISDSEITKRVEFYDVIADAWIELPELSVETCSSSLFEFKSETKNLLLSIAGLNRDNDKQVRVLNII